MNRPSRFALLLAFLSMVAIVRGELTVSLQPVGPSAEGGFRAQPNERFEWVLGYYAFGASKRPEPTGLASFGIVSLGTTTPVTPGAVFNVELKQQMRSDGRSGITAATAFLYEAYATGRIHQWLPNFLYDEAAAIALQSAITALEGGHGTVSAEISALLSSHFGSAIHANERYSGSSVRIFTLTAADGSGSGGDYLIYLPDPANADSPGMPVIGSRGISTPGSGGGGGGGGVIVNPPPVVPPNVDLDEVIEEIVTTLPPVINPPADEDITSSTPPTPPPPKVPEKPGVPPVTDPFDPTDKGNPPVQVPDHGTTLPLLIAALAALRLARRR